MRVTIKKLYQIEKIEGALNKTASTSMKPFASGWMVDENLIPYMGIEVDAGESGDKYLFNGMLIPKKWTK